MARSPGPLLTRLLVGRLGLSGLLLVAASGLAVVIVLIYRWMNEKARLRECVDGTQLSNLSHALNGNGPRRGPKRRGP